MSLIIIVLATVVSILGILKFIVWYRPRRLDYYIVLPYTLFLTKHSNIFTEQQDESDYSDELLRRLTKETGTKTNSPSHKKFSMRACINLADVVDYCEWTTSGFEDEKVYADAVNIRFTDGTDAVFNVTYDYFDSEFTNYLNIK
jgi:hypothetical protein